MFEITSESLISLKEACASLPGRPHISTIWRWIQRGIDGIRLETVKVGGKRFTSAEALERFIQATTAASGGRPQVSTSAVSQNRIAQANRVCDEAGL